MDITLPPDFKEFLRLLNSGEVTEHVGQAGSLPNKKSVLTLYHKEKKSLSRVAG